jgi:hypothetical protein
MVFLMVPGCMMHLNAQRVRSSKGQRLEPSCYRFMLTGLFGGRRFTVSVYCQSRADQILQVLNPGASNRPFSHSAKTIPDRGGPPCPATSGTAPVATGKTAPPVVSLGVTGSRACPGSPQEGPACSAATAKSPAERNAGGPCGPTWASPTHASCSWCSCGVLMRPARRFSRSR